MKCQVIVEKGKSELRIFQRCKNKAQIGSSYAPGMSLCRKHFEQSHSNSERMSFISED